MSILGLLRSHRRDYLLGGLFLIATNLCGNGIPWLMKHAVEAIEAHTLEKMGGLCAGLVALSVVGALVRIGSRSFIFNGARLIEYDMRNTLFAHLVRLAPSFYQRYPTGDLMSRVTNDVTYVRLLFGPGVLNIINTICAYAMALPLLVLIDARLALYTVVPIPLMLLLSRGVARRIQTRQRAVQDSLADISSRLHQSLSGVPVVKAYCLEEREDEAFQKLNLDYLDRSIKFVIARGTLMPLVGSIAGIGTLIVLFSGGAAVANGRISLGDLVAFMGYLGLLTWPTLALGWVISSWQRGMAALERLREVLDEAPTIVAPPEAIPLPEAKGALELRRLSIGYGGGRPVLNDISTKIPAGGSLGIVGRSASGKTTLVRSLLRLLEMEEGLIFLDGHDLTKLDLADARRAFAYVPQESYLFSTSIQRNLAFGVLRPGEDAAHIDVQPVASMAALDRDVQAFHLGYQTLVGERGITLSGGQKQRAAIARALLTERPILVLDDALSNVDAETEQAILRGVRDTASKRTVIVTSHRMSAVAWCDQILVLKDGRLDAQGDHQTLLAQGGWYADMWALQQGPSQNSEARP